MRETSNIASRSTASPEVVGAERSVAVLRSLSEPLCAISLWHLEAPTRERLQRNALSVNAYPNDVGGLVYVGSKRQRIPLEPDLDVITALAECAGAVWLLFDVEGPVLPGIPLYPPDTPCR